MDNVNNLNGVPNFGHGFPEEDIQVPAPQEAEEVEITNTNEDEE